MQDWKSVFGSYLNTGVYDMGKRINMRQIKKAAFVNGLDFTAIELKNSLDKNSILKTIANALKFPSYFGLNWDALNDCLTDMSWNIATGYVIVFTNFKSVVENMAVESAFVKSILVTSAQYWKQKKVQFYVILSA